MTPPVPTPGRFGARLHSAMADHGPLCVGIDPHPGLLTAWGLPDSPAGLRTFSRTVIDAMAGAVAAVKPQAAFFERHGAAGMTVLEEIVHTCRERSLLCIVDAKRGDIGSTMAGYADAYLTEGAPFAGDALTVSPYLGVDSLADMVDTASGNNRGVFVLALTSNPEGSQVQHARGAGGVAVAAAVASAAQRWNTGTEPLGDVGLVVGVTTGAAARSLGVDLDINGALLAPGLGAQGGRVDDLPGIFDAALPRVLVSTSREILRRGPAPEDLRSAAVELTASLRSTGRDLG